MTNPEKTEPTRPREVKFRDVALRVADDQPTFWDRVEAGRWEPGTLAAIDRWVGPATTFLDLGAWVGPTALYAAARGAMVLALEADPAALDQLGRNLKANPGLAARVRVLPRAIHATGGPVTFGARRKPGDSMSSVLLVNSATTWSAEAITPRELAADVEGAERLFVKLDIEGGEYELLPAMAPLIGRARTAVLVSFHPKILASVMPDPAAQVAATARALGAFAGFAAYALQDGGLVASVPVAAAIATRAVTDEWLFVRET